MTKPWSQTPTQVLNHWQTNRIHGLSHAQVRERWRRFGANQLQNTPSVPIYRRLIGQLANPLTLLLCFTLVLTILHRQTTDSLIIALVVVANSLIGFFQEQKAEEVMRRLHRILSPHARVIRESVEQKILARFLVPGDIVLLEAGDRIPADGRLIDCRNLLVNEAMLTGEALPQAKRDALLSPSTNLSDRTNMGYLGTVVVGGAATLIVTATGNDTELGQIAKEVRSLADQPEEITRQINRLGAVLLGVGLALAAVTLLVGVVAGYGYLEMLTIVSSLLVSMVPEGLPIVLTVILALGVKNIFAHGAIVRKLAAAETLGSVSTICVDKTGTLTEDKLTVERLLVAGSEYRVSGDGYRLSGHFYFRDEKIDITQQPAARLLLELSSLATLAPLGRGDLKRDEAKTLTDPTETALAVVAAKAGYYAFEEEKAHPELLELPYDHRRQASVSVHRYGRGERLIAKGSPEDILELSTTALNAQAVRRRLLGSSRSELLEVANKWAENGYRVIALAYRDRVKEEKVAAGRLGELTFVGFLAMSDQLRLDARAAIQEAQAAGVKVMMLTGDHLLTAETIAKKVGLSPEPVTVHADEINARSLLDVDVVARLSPSQKLSVVRSLQKHGQVVAMTGDGINDTPALKAADIGVAIGRGGSDAAQEAADMVLLDNQLAAIVAAIKQGRLIWANLRKVIYYLLSTSVAEALILIGSLWLGLPLPLTAVQILWMNLVTDGITSTALAFEPAEAGLMSRRSPLRRSLVDRSLLTRTAVATLVMTLGTLWLYRGEAGNPALARSIALTTMVFFQIFNLFASRSETKSVTQLSLAANRPLLGLFGLALTLQLLAIYHPLGNRALGTVPLDVNSLFLSAGVAASIIVVDELVKWLKRQLRLWALSQAQLAEPVEAAKAR